jgi:hypothetical protein
VTNASAAGVAGGQPGAYAGASGAFAAADDDRDDAASVDSDGALRMAARRDMCDLRLAFWGG